MLGQACCATNVGLDFDGGLQIGDSVADVKIVRRANGGRSGGVAPGSGFLQQVERAVQSAVHPNANDLSDARAQRGNSGGGGAYQVYQQGSPEARVASSLYIGGGDGGSQVIPFSVVSPYRPLTATRVPVEGLTAFPKSGYYFNGEPVSDFNVDGDDPNDTPGHESLGFFDPAEAVPTGIGLPSYQQPAGPSKLQTILGAIATTLPATISAFKSQPYYNPAQGVVYQPGQQGGMYPGGAVADVGAQAGAAVGNIGDTISNIVAQHPYLVLGAGAAVLLLFMKPPSRR